MLKTWIWWVSLLGGILSISGDQGSFSEKKSPPNILFILTDDQGWTHVSHRADPAIPSSASDFYETPQLDRLADLGMRFTRGYAPNPICSPTRHSVLFGQNAARHIYNQDLNWYRQAAEKLTIPKAIKAAHPAYRTAHFGKWHVALLPEDSGFDQHDGMTSNGQGNVFGDQLLGARPYAKAAKQYLKDQQQEAPEGIHLAGKPSAYWHEENPKDIVGLTDRAIDFMQESQVEGKPFFVQLSHYATHLALSAREETYAHFADKPPGSFHSNPEFAAMLKDLDTSIGRLLDFLLETGMAENTYIFLMGDNGGRRSLNQIAIIDQDQQLASAKYSTQPNRNLPLRDGKHSFYEGGLRVPFLVVGPGIQAQRVSRVPVSGLDLLPTFAELAGQAGQDSPLLDGGSLVPLFKDPSLPQVQRDQEALFFHQGAHRKPRSALIKGRYKLIKYWSKESKYPHTPKVELFDLQTDLAETQDLATQFPELTAELTAELLHFLETTGAETRRLNIEDPFDRLVQETEGKSDP